MDYSNYNKSQRKGQWLYNELLDLYPNTKELLDNSNIFYDDNNIVKLVGTHFSHLMNDKFFKWLYGVDEVKTLKPNRVRTDSFHYKTTNSYDGNK